VPPEVRQLADNYLLDPVTIKVKAATLTIDTVEQFYLQCTRDEKVGELVRIIEAEQPSQAIVFVRTKIRCDQLYRTLRDKGLDVKALHGDMSQGSRDGVMIAFKSERLRILVATDVAARGLDISSVTHILNFDIPTSPDVYVHRIGRTGRVGRSGRAITLVEPRQRRELEAIERHARTTIAPWIEGAHVKPEPVVERPHRHAKPHVHRNGREPHRKLIVGAGRAAGLEVADLVTAITRATGLDGEAVRNVRVLERFSFLEVPESDVFEVLARVNGTEVRGTRLALETAAA
jgi:ATP-dependent RNA helicase DeaD